MNERELKALLRRIVRTSKQGRAFLKRKFGKKFRQAVGDWFISPIICEIEECSVHKGKGSVRACYLACSVVDGPSSQAHKDIEAGADLGDLDGAGYLSDYIPQAEERIDGNVPCPVKRCRNLDYTAMDVVTHLNDIHKFKFEKIDGILLKMAKKKNLLVDTEVG